MTALFTRAGEVWSGAVNDPDSKPHGWVRDRCHRCGGPGRIEAYRHVEGGICFRCNGAQLEPEARRVPLYTAERLAKLNATAERKAGRLRDKAEAARAQAEAETGARRVAFEAEHAELLAWLRGAGAGRDGDFTRYRDGFLGDMLRRAETEAQWSDAQFLALDKAYARALAEAERAKSSRFVGAIGERLEITVTAEREAEYQRRTFGFSYSGDGFETVYIATLRDERGNAFVVKSPSLRFAVGDTEKIRGTVKDHKEFRGECQTILARVARRA